MQALAINVGQAERKTASGPHWLSLSLSLAPLSVSSFLFSLPLSFSAFSPLFLRSAPFSLFSLFSLYSLSLYFLSLYLSLSVPLNLTIYLFF